MLRTIKRRAREALATVQYNRYSRHLSAYDVDLSFTQAALRFSTRQELYRYMHHYFHHLGPKELREHRQWFSRENRGFGEDAFHAMWYLLLREFRPQRCLEIGVYRGQIISLWALIADLLGLSCEIHGVSPFSSAGDQVSRYVEIDYLSDTLQSFAKFSRKKPELLKAYSTDQAARDYIASRQWDMIYIDGSHDFDVVLSDYRLSLSSLVLGALLIMDDSSLRSDYRPLLFSFGGHPGPSDVFDKIAVQEMKFLGGVGHNNVLVKT